MDGVSESICIRSRLYKRSCSSKWLMDVREAKEVCKDRVLQKASKVMVMLLAFITQGNIEYRVMICRPYICIFMNLVCFRPLDEPKKLKEKFDLIFDAAKYNKAADVILKLVKKKAASKFAKNYNCFCILSNNKKL